MIYIIAGLGVLAADLLTKAWLDRTLAVGESIPIIEQIFHITYARNQGAAFSIFYGHVEFLVVFSLLAIGLLIGFAYKYRHDQPAFAGGVLAISGALGNLYDRVIFGYVRDFLDFRVFPIFNVADMAIVTGMLLLAIRVLWLERDGQDGKPGNEGTDTMDR